jgi:hypothetical protein
MIGADELVTIFSARLDETGTNERSPYTIVSGAVASLAQWKKLETAWSQLLARAHIQSFHSKEFNAREVPFDTWSDFKCKRFSANQDKLVKKHTLFRIAVGVDDAVHAEIKAKMKGVKGFRADSNYGLCLRYLMFLACETIEKQITSDFKMTIMLEDGPWAAGAVNLYTRVSAMTGKWKPAKHAHRLAGISVIPKGGSLSLEAADYLAGIYHKRMLCRRFSVRDNPQVAILLNRKVLERWYEGMVAEKESRRDYARKRKPDGKTV